MPLWGGGWRGVASGTCSKRPPGMKNMTERGDEEAPRGVQMLSVRQSSLSLWGHMWGGSTQRCGHPGPNSATRVGEPQQRRGRRRQRQSANQSKACPIKF